MRVDRVAADASATRRHRRDGSSPAHSGKGVSARLCTAAFFAALAHAARPQRRRTDTCAKKHGNTGAGSHLEAAPNAQKLPPGRDSGRSAAPESRTPSPRLRPRVLLALGGPPRAASKANRPSVDTPRSSDMVENRKTCGISIGSASSTPPVALAAAYVRRLARMASDDDQKADRGVRRWVSK